MTSERQRDFVRSDQVGDIRIPIDQLPDLFKVSRRTIERWLAADTITRHPYNGSKFGDAPGKAVRLGDLIAARSETTGRWVKREDTPTQP